MVQKLVRMKIHSTNHGVILNKQFAINFIMYYINVWQTKTVRSQAQIGLLRRRGTLKAGGTALSVQIAFLNAQGRAAHRYRRSGASLPAQRRGRKYKNSPTRHLYK